jgi:glucose-6-phosphate 1-dehydrogenase
VIERIIIFGASGDLTRRLLMPGLAQLAEEKALPHGLKIVGAASHDWSTEDFREQMRQGLAEHASAVSAEARDRLLAMLSYAPADVTDANDVRRVVGEQCRNTLIYLALPTALLETVLSTLAGAGLGSTDAVAIEKPFGSDLESARHLNELLRTRMPHPTVFRIDHFLSDDLVRQVIALRFGNRVFEPTWNATQVERVDISWMESLALEGRASYYDRAGALKDMVQNHLMEALALVLMAEPARFDADSIRDMRVEALRTVATPTPRWIRGHTVRARYTAGSIESRKVPSYVDEPGVDPARNTETYASVTLEVESARWEGVPFTLRSGKAMAADHAEIAVHFRPLGRRIRRHYPGVEPNVFRLGLMQPYITLTAMTIGDARQGRQHELELHTPEPRRTPYANLLLEMLRGDATLFIRGDEAEESWRIIDPVAKAWAAGEVPLQDYPAGGEPPGVSRPRPG